MRISVIIVNWNRLELLRASLASVAAQSVPAFETIVVDNGSSDGSVEMINLEFPSVRVIRNAENRGFCAANNQGFTAARGELVALLNNDAEAEQCWLDELAKAMSEDARIGMAASKILVHGDPTRIDKAGHLIYPDGQNRGRGTGEIDRGQYDKHGETLWPDGCAAMYRMEMIRMIGGFDEDFFAYGDDAELGLRARIAGWKCAYVPGAVVRHHRGSTLGLKSPLRLELIERNRLLLAMKLFPLSLLVLNPFYYAARIAANGVASAMNAGEASAYSGLKEKLLAIRAMVRADLRALWLFRRMLQKRRALRNIRSLSPREVRQLILNNRISLKELTMRKVPPL